MLHKTGENTVKLKDIPTITWNPTVGELNESYIKMVNLLYSRTKKGKLIAEGRKFGNKKISNSYKRIFNVLVFPKEYKKITRDNAKNETKRLLTRFLEIKNWC